MLGRVNKSIALQTLDLLLPRLLLLLRPPLARLLLPLLAEEPPDASLDPDDRPDLDDVSSADLAADERAGEDLGVVLLEGRLRHLHRVHREHEGVLQVLGQRAGDRSAGWMTKRERTFHN